MPVTYFFNLLYTDLKHFPIQCVVFKLGGVLADFLSAIGEDLIGFLDAEKNP